MPRQRATPSERIAKISKRIRARRAEKMLTPPKKRSPAMQKGFCTLCKNVAANRQKPWCTQCFKLAME